MPVSHCDNGLGPDLKPVSTCTPELRQMSAVSTASHAPEAECEKVAEGLLRRAHLSARQTPRTRNAPQESKAARSSLGWEAQ